MNVGVILSYRAVAIDICQDMYGRNPHEPEYSATELARLSCGQLPAEAWVPIAARLAEHEFAAKWFSVNFVVNNPFPAWQQG